MDTLDEIENRVNDMVNTREAEIDELNEQIEEEQSTIETARAEMSKASDASDLKKYQAAKRKLNDAQDGLEMHSQRLNKLSETPAISPEEYTDLKAEVCACMDQIVEDSKPQLVAASESMNEIGNRISGEAKRANDLLAKIQGRLYLNSDRKTDSNGNYITHPAEYKNHFSVLGWARSGVHNALYKEATAGKGGASRE